MKISSTMDLLKVPQYGTEPRERKLVSDALPMTDNQPVKVTISEEGLKS